MCTTCDLNTWTYELTFGFDGRGPWATLGCSEPGCGSHQAVRPLDDADGMLFREDELVPVLFDFAERAGWEFGHGAFCSEHHRE